MATKAKAMGVGWKKRARRNRVGSRVWGSICERYQIVANELVFGVKIRPVRYAVWFTRRVRDLDRWFTSEVKIGVYASRKKAELAAERHRKAEYVREI